MGAARTHPPLHLPRALQHPWVAPWGGRRTLWVMRGGCTLPAPPAAPLSSAPLAAAGAERSCQPRACQAALAFCSPWTLLARGHCLAWQAWGGHEHEANAPAGSILPASPCPVGVLSAARAKRGHPWRAPTRWDQRGLRFPWAGIYCQGNRGELSSCDFDICYCKLLQDVLEPCGLAAPRDFSGCCALGSESSWRKRWSVRGPHAARVSRVPSGCAGRLRAGL